LSLRREGHTTGRQVRSSPV